MFFKYNYKKFMKDVESIAYDREGIELIFDLSEELNPEDAKQFILSHVSLVNCLFLKNFTSIPVQVTKIERREHMKSLRDLFLKHAAEIGFVLKSELDKDRFREFFDDSVNNLYDTDVTMADAEISIGQYLTFPMERSIYMRAVNHQVLENMKCISKLVKAKSS